MDADFVLAGSPSTKAIDAALAPLGFSRQGRRYTHPLVQFSVDFPSGPLGIGSDVNLRPVLKSHKNSRALLLSPTDACRDRLAAYYHWRDIQSLTTAVAIARRQKLAFAKIRAWSAREGYAQGYAEFLAELRRSRAPRKIATQAKRSRRQGA